MATLISRLKCGARDDDMYVIAALLWLVSLLRVALALTQREVFGVDATLALFCVAGLPWAFLAKRAVGGSGSAFALTRRAR